MRTGNDNEQGKSEIKLNRKMRMWHKYRNYAIGGAGLIIIIFVCAFVIKNIGGGASEAANGETTANQQSTEIAQDQTTSQEIPGTEETEPETTTEAPKQKTYVYKLEGTADSQDFTTKDSYGSSVFLGDSIADGISYYGYLGSSSVVSDGNLTIEKAKDKVSQATSSNPSKVFLMVGLNDINFGTKSADRIVTGILELADQTKQSASSADVYVVSIMPITKQFEAKPTTNIKQSVIDEINQKLQEQLPSHQVGFIDAASAFKDGTGYLGSSYTGNGSNIYNEYYPFLLNGIANSIQ